MSWVKKLWNRMFADEVEEAFEQEQSLPLEQQRANVPFRFPVITDEEREVFLNKEQSGQKVTMAEVREELMRRPKQPINQNPRSAFRPEPRAAQRAAARPPVQPQTRVSPAKQEVKKPEPVKRRFEPTKIPSPIHGFKERKPESISTLLENKELKKDFEQAILPENSLKKESVEPLVNNVNNELGSMNLEQKPVPEPQVSASTKEPSVHMEKATETKELSESNGTPETPETPEIHETIETPETPATPEVSEVKKKEKTVPFNVLMLKSDKEKYRRLHAVDKVESVPVPTIPQSAPQAEEAPILIEEKAEAEQVVKETVAPVAKETLNMPTAESYEFPHMDFLQRPLNDRKDDEWMEEQGERLIEALSHFQVKATILSIVQGPAVTQFELTVAQGVKVSKIRNLADDLKLALAAKDIRIQAPIPGKSSIGIEIPNRTSRPVRISEVIGSSHFSDSDSPLEAALGLDLTGKPVTLDLRKMPHGLIAGATGSGKSVCINSLLVSLLYKSSPRDLKLLLIDPKMVELAPYNHIPHLVSPVITDVKAATASLKWAVSEMERRYQLFAHTGVRDISRYNKLVKEKGDYAQHLPYILIVIDELADLMMMSPSDVEDAICRIAQKARACGIHLVIATQRPSVDVITGLIKSNIPTRIAFSVSSQVDSRTILDSQGAERLLGRGDMLYLGNGMSAPSRIQGTFVTDEEIERIIDHVRSQGEPEYFFKEEELIKMNASGEEQDDLFEEACRFIMQQGSASTSLLQRKFHIGYNRAARLMDLIEEHGFISEQNGSKARTVLITEDDITEVFQ